MTSTCIFMGGTFASYTIYICIFFILFKSMACVQQKKETDTVLGHAGK